MPHTQQNIQVELEQANARLENYKHAFDALVEENVRLKSMLEHIPNGVALIDETGKPIQNNRALGTMLGYSDDELMNMSFTEFTHPDDLDEDLEYYRQLLRGEITGYSLEKRYIHRSGKIIWAYLSVTSYKDSRGKLQVLASVVEANNIKHLEKLIKRQQAGAGQPGSKPGSEAASELDMTPVCSYCHKIRELDGDWKKFETHLNEHYDTAFTHGICPDCVDREFRKSGNGEPRST